MTESKALAFAGQNVAIQSPIERKPEQYRRRGRTAEASVTYYGWTTKRDVEQTEEQ